MATGGGRCFRHCPQSGSPGPASCPRLPVMPCEAQRSRKLVAAGVGGRRESSVRLAARPPPGPRPHLRNLADPTRRIEPDRPPSKRAAGGPWRPPTGPGSAGAPTHRASSARHPSPPKLPPHAHLGTRDPPPSPRRGPSRPRPLSLPSDPGPGLGTGSGQAEYEGPSVPKKQGLLQQGLGGPSNQTG